MVGAGDGSLAIVMEGHGAVGLYTLLPGSDSGSGGGDGGGDSGGGPPAGKGKNK